MVVRVADEGRGFDPAETEIQGDEAFGLYSLRERIGLFGGHGDIDAAPGDGTRVAIRMPTGGQSS